MALVFSDMPGRPWRTRGPAARGRWRPGRRAAATPIVVVFVEGGHRALPATATLAEEGRDLGAVESVVRDVGPGGDDARMTLLDAVSPSPAGSASRRRLPAAATTCLRWCRADAPRGNSSIGQTGVMAEPRGDETVELLQTLIRNACVNDGHMDSGQEIRNADVLTTYLEGPASRCSSITPPRGGRRSSPGSRGPTPTPSFASTATPMSYRSAPTAGTRIPSAAR